jgi:hypothetical protein
MVSYDSLDESPISPGIVMLAVLVLAMTLPMALHALRNLRKKQTLINSLQVIIGLGSALFQFVHFILACIFATMTKSGVFQRALWGLLICSLSCTMAINFWRFRMFDYVLPKFIFKSLKAKIIIPVTCVFASSLTWPLFAFIFAEFLEDWAMIWTKLGIAVFLITYIVTDASMNIAAFKFVLALRKGVSGSEVLSEAQMRFRKLSIVTLVVLIVIDSAFVACILVLSLMKEFPYAIMYCSMVFSVSMMHVSLSYLFTTLVVKFMAKNAKKLKFPKAKRSASKTAEESQANSMIPMPMSHTASVADRPARTTETPPSTGNLIQLTPPSTATATYVVGGTGLNTGSLPTPSMSEGANLANLSVPAFPSMASSSSGDNNKQVPLSAVADSVNESQLNSMLRVPSESALFQPVSPSQRMGANVNLEK